MLKGLTTSLIVTVFWVLVQIAFTHIKKPKNHFKAIFYGYLISLPLIALFYVYVPLFNSFDLKTDCPGLIHAYIGHFLLFLLYFEVFKHLSRSISLNFMIELLDSPNHENNAFELQKHYSLDEMIEKRLKFLEDDGYIIKNNGKWFNTQKGNKFTLFAGFFIKLFRSKTQKERN